jgi:diketogulonate reductase-like aldo/keto reductase
VSQQLTLNTGRQLPAIGFGTWELQPDGPTQQAVLTALDTGYRVIDTAKLYGNEHDVGAAVRESGIPRQEICVVTKVWNDDQGYERTLAACERSLEQLGLDYIDIYLIHWPATTRRHDSWRAMEKLQNDGLIKAAGVSNYTVEHLEELRSQSELVPAINQVEFHPYIYEQQQAVLEYCQQQNILVQAYSPLSRLQHHLPPAIKSIAKAHAKTPEQVLIRWCIDHGTMPLPRSANPQHIAANFDVFDFSLTDDDLDQLDSLSDGQRVTWDPAGMGQGAH